MICQFSAKLTWGISLKDGSMRVHGIINSISVTAVNSLSLAGDAYTGKTGTLDHLNRINSVLHSDGLAAWPVATNRTDEVQSGGSELVRSRMRRAAHT